MQRIPHFIEFVRDVKNEKAYKLREIARRSAD